MTSRLPGQGPLSPGEHQERLQAHKGLSPQDFAAPTVAGEAPRVQPSQRVESVVGGHPMPWSLAANVRIDGTDALVPMVSEEPSIVAAARTAAKLVRLSGGFGAEAQESHGRGPRQAQLKAEGVSRKKGRGWLCPRFGRCAPR